MKRTLYGILFGAAALLSAAYLGACADLGMGVDVSSGTVNPYWYGNGYLGQNYWETPVWNYGPIYRPHPPRPQRPVVALPSGPIINTSPGPVINISPKPPVVNANPGMNGVPSQVGGIQRPGNGGRPNPASVPRGEALE